MDTGATNHAYAERKWFSSSKKLDGGLVSFCDDHTCHIEGIDSDHIKLSGVMVRELKDVRYAPKLKKNVILIGALEVQGLRGTLEEGFSRCSVTHWLF